MRRLFLLLLLLLAYGLAGRAQTDGKLSASTQMFLNRLAQRGQVEVASVADDDGGRLADGIMATRRPLLAETQVMGGVEYVPAFIRADSTVLGALREQGVVVESQFRGFMTARIPVDKVEAVAAIDDVAEISVATMAEMETDQAREKTGVADALSLSPQARRLGLPQAYTGKGVIVGIIDTGIDFNHRAFKDQDGNSRIVKALAVERNGTGDLQEYGPAEIASLTTDYDGSDHGTHTSSIAGGSEVEIGGVTYGGMAPEADLVLCGIGSSSTTTKIVNSMKFICDYADAVRKPCVINMSFGSQTGPHDGTGYLQEACRELAGPGHILVNSGGNDADHSTTGGMYVYGQASKSSPLNTIFNSHYYSNRDDHYYYNCYASAWARTANVALGVRVMVINKNTNKVVWTSSAFTSSSGSITSTTRAASSSTTFGTYYEILDGGSFDITIKKNSYNNKYQVLIDMSKVRSKSYESGDNFRTSNYAIAFSFYPTGSTTTYVDCWSNSGGYYTGNTAVSGYTFTDGSNLCCSNDRAGTDSLILVGAYVTRKDITDHNGKDYTIASYELGNYAPFSSYTVEGYGPTGLMEPTISAPGATIVSAVNHYSSKYTDDSNATASRVRVNDDAENPYGNMAGTSMAAPCATGVVALWLQANPRLSVAEAKRLMRETAIHDEFTDDSEGGVHFGNGKLNALGGLLALTEGQRLVADVNRDGSVTIADVTALVNILLGKDSAEPYQYDHWAADVNADGSITIADVTALVNILLGKE